MSMLNRKLTRDLGAMASQVLAIALVLAAGVAMFIMALSSLEALRNAQADYYREYRFAEVFANAKRAPLSLLPRLEQIPGVSSVDTRIVAQVTLDVPHMSELAVGRFISLPDHRPPRHNLIYLVQGRWFDPAQSGEVIVSQSFAEAHRLHPGSELSALINGKRRIFKIVGTALSPEYVIQIQPGSMLPDHRRFGIFWLSQREMQAAFEMEGAFNDVSIVLERGAGERAVIKQLDDLLDRYGGTGAYGRSQQTSHAYLTDEIRQLGTMAVVAPTIFLGVAAFLLNVVVARLVTLQREQIAALKAFGYSDWEVGSHYLKIVLVIALMGGALGIGGGYLLAQQMTRTYAEFYQFPKFQVRLPPLVLLYSLAFSALAALLGVGRSLRSAMTLPPAEAMRPEAPATFRPTLVERWGWGTAFSPATRMVLRQIERRPMKSFNTVIGIGLGVAILMLGSFSLDAIRYILNFQFRIAQRQQLTVGFGEPTGVAGAISVSKLAGVNRAEPFRVISARVSRGSRSKKVAISGIAQASQLYRTLDTQERVVQLPASGLILNDKLAELLAVKVGERVVVSVLEGTRPQLELTVTQIITEYGGVNAYMSLAALQEILEEGELYSGVFLGVEPTALPNLFTELKRLPRISTVTIKDAARQNFENTVAENILMMRTFNTLFAVVIAFGVVYNSARISLSEKGRELATLRVMGFTQWEVSTVMLGELALLTLAAVPVGWLIGWGLIASFVTAMDTEMYRIPLVIDRATYGLSALVVVVAAAVSGLIVQRKIQNLDMIAVLKTKE